MIIYHFINTHKDKWSVEMMCKVLEVSSSAYYAWRKEPYGKRYKDSSRIQRDIKRIYFAAKGRYGSPRIAKEMESQGIKLSRRTVAKYMKEMGLKNKLSCKYRPTTHGFVYLTVVIDLFDRQPIGWTISDRMTAAETIIPALQKAVRNRKLQANMLFHSDTKVEKDL